MLELVRIHVNNCKVVTCTFFKVVTYRFIYLHTIRICCESLHKEKKPLNIHEWKCCGSQVSETDYGLKQLMAILDICALMDIFTLKLAALSLQKKYKPELDPERAN